LAGDELHPIAQPRALTQALRQCGALGDGRVSAVTVESVKPTILSRIARVRLSYEGPAEGAPGSLIVKTALTTGSGQKSTGGRSEVAFYGQVGRAMTTPPLPRCYAGAWRPDTNDWFLLLEDLTDTHASIGAWPLPPAREDAERIIGAWARFHAVWWDDSRLGTTVGRWLDPGDGQLKAFEERLKWFADRLGGRLSDERRDFYRRLVEAGPRLNRRYHSHQNMTVVHGDAHAWNVFLPKDGSDDLRLFDWDSWRIDTATDDLAYMMALHWYPEHRERDEQHLLDHYHQGLLVNGVTGYDRQALDDDYRLSVLWQATTPVWQAANQIPPWIWWPHLDRIFTAIDDLGCRELLEG
jgi:hypothetical protein